MIAFTLETLVLRGVVRKDELGVPRLFGVETLTGRPGDVNSVLPPARTGPDTDPANPKVGYPTKGERPRAGRSCRHAGSSARQSIVRSAAIWRRQPGGTALAAAAIAQALAAGIVATVGEVVSPRLAVLSLGMRGRSR
jgi:hypothetical protein